jgi:NADH:ubiquinone oxidoreductase subunit H
MTASSLEITLFSAKLGMAFLVIPTLAWHHYRKGTNFVCPFGLPHPLADLTKPSTKEDLFQFGTSLTIYGPCCPKT